MVGQFFLIKKIFRGAFILSSLKLPKIDPAATQAEIKREALGILMRSAKTHFPEGV